MLIKHVHYPHLSLKFQFSMHNNLSVTLQSTSAPFELSVHRRENFSHLTIIVIYMENMVLQFCAS